MKNLYYGCNHLHICYPWGGGGGVMSFGTYEASVPLLLMLSLPMLLLDKFRYLLISAFFCNDDVGLDSTGITLIGYIMPPLLAS